MDSLPLPRFRRANFWALRKPGNTDALAEQERRGVLGLFLLLPKTRARLLATVHFRPRKVQWNAET